MKGYKITTKDIDIVIPANDPQEAYAKFFLEVKKGNISIDDLGNILMLHDEGEEYPFRIVPTLWLMKIIGPETAIVTLQVILEIEDEDEAANVLLSSARQDSWILDKMKEIEVQASEGTKI